MTEQCFINSENSCWVEIKGPDSGKFLNGVLTNNIQKLQGKTGCYNLLLTPKGKIVADCFCYTCGDHFGITCTAFLKPILLENLKKYIIFQKVDVVDQSEKWGALSILGSKAKESLQPLLKDLPNDEFSYTEPCWDNLQLFVIYKIQWGLPFYELWTHREKIPELKNKFDLPLPSKEEEEVLRIESGTPLFGVDFNENTIPQEANLYNALSFDKGCYVGQEIVARLEHRGHVGKQLVQLICEDKNPPPRGEKIFSFDNQEIGTVTSSCFSPQRNQAIGLGYVRYNFLQLAEAKIGKMKAKIKTVVKHKAH